jgi:hypothetical protein
MKKRHEHGVPHPHMRETMESPQHRSASSLRPSVFCIRFSVTFFNLGSLIIDALFSIVWNLQYHRCQSSPILANPRQSSPTVAIDLLESWTDAQRRSLSLAEWISLIQMQDSYAHIRKASFNGLTMREYHDHGRTS